MNKYLKDYGFLLGLSGLLILLDQYTKHLIRTTMELGQVTYPFPEITTLIRLVHWSNTGAAFGIFQQFGDVFTVLAIIVSVAILYYFPQVPKDDWLLRLALGLQLAGAIGNLIDRVIYGSVTDFISVGRFAVFNIADACISLGVVLLVVSMWLRENREKSTPQPGSTAHGPTDSEKIPEAVSEEIKGE